MRDAWFRFAVTGVTAAAMMLAFGASPGTAQSRAHVYLFRGLADVYSLGMNTLADELNARGIYATAHSHTDWQPIADKAAAAYKAGKEGPIILIGHSLGADAVMEMADYLGDKGVPVALVVPFDGTQSFPAPGNVGRVINFTQRDYAYMRPGPGFRGSLSNVDLSADPNITHTTIDKSPRLHALVITAVLAVVEGHGGVKTERKPVAPAPPENSGDGVEKSTGTTKQPDSGTSTTAPPEQKAEPTISAAPATSPAPQKPAVAPGPAKPAEFPD
jgi:pimeloyl-ACP methyl ester carboxylesterase